MTKNQQLNELFEEWKKHYTKYGIDATKFSEDGIINEEEYDKAPKKILFVLRETNDFAGGDLRQLFHNGPHFPAFYQMARWAAGILKDFPPFADVGNSPEILNWALKSVSLINIKKYTGGAVADFNLLSAFAFLDREFIRQEIKIIAPELIVCCNTFIELMWALEIDEVKIHLADLAKTFDRLYEWNGIKIVLWPHHPSDRKANKRSYDELAALFRKQGLLSAG